MSEPTLLFAGFGDRVTGTLLPALRQAAIPLRVAAVCDPAPDTPARVGDMVAAGLLPADVRLHTTVDEALADASYDVAVVACPHDLHQPITLRLAAAGVVVWKEKPFALNLADAQELAGLDGRGIRVLAHRPHGQLYGIAARGMRDWGRLVSYRIRITRETGDYSRTWRAFPDRAGGGAILDLGYHAFDLVARFGVAPTSVYTVTAASPAHRPAVAVEENAHLTITHADGCVGAVYVSRCDDRADDVDLVTERGRITITGASARIQVRESGGLCHTVELTADENPWARMLRYHAETRNDRAVTAAEVRVGVAATALMDAAYASLRSGQPASVTPAHIAPALEGIA